MYQVNRNHVLYLSLTVSIQTSIVGISRSLRANAMQYACYTDLSYMNSILVCMSLSKKWLCVVVLYVFLRIKMIYQTKELYYKRMFCFWTTELIGVFSAYISTSHLSLRHYLQRSLMYRLIWLKLKSFQNKSCISQTWMIFENNFFDYLLGSVEL